MKLNEKTYKILKIQKHFKTFDLFFFANGPNSEASGYLGIKQGLKAARFKLHKTLNKLTKVALRNSIYTSVIQTITGSTFLLKPKEHKLFSKQTVLTTFNSLFFELLALKLNNKTYSSNTLQKIYSLEYRETKLLVCQFGITSLKTGFKLSK